jgi:dipeptidyl aminopeptidase/acylaminoacyl peptidase
MRKLAVALAATSIAGAVGCSSDSTTIPDPLAKVPNFIYVSDQSGSDQLYTFSGGTSTLFPGTVSGDADPQSAHGVVVFTSYRDSPTNSEIYSENIDGTNIVRLTNNAALDFKPSLSPDGTTIAFASLRSGTSKIWIMNADGTSPTAVATGADQYTPETAPRFSPDGTQLLFNSPRSGTSQLWIMPTAGGTAVQLTHEVNGAFDGSWSADGASAFYVSGLDHADVHQIVISTGAVTDYVTGGTDVSQPECNADVCLVVSGAGSSAGDILAYVGPGVTSPAPVVHSAANERQPAILHP